MFFKIKNKKLSLNLDYLLFYDEFAKIYREHEEEIAIKIFKYIYEVSDERSYSNRNVLSKAKAHNHAVTMTGLGDTFSITPDIKKAIDKYKKLTKDTNAILLKDLKSTLNLSRDINKKIYKALELKLQNPELPEADIPSLITLQNKLFETIDGLPDKFKKIKELETEVYEELSKPPVIARGGEIAPASYDGDETIEGTS